MTRRSLRPCAGSPLCPELTSSGYCADHQPVRPSPDARGYDNTWRRTRAAYLERVPYCEECGATSQTANAPLHVDHLDGLGPNGPRGHDPANLQTLCPRCHGLKTYLQTNRSTT